MLGKTSDQIAKRTLRYRNYLSFLLAIWSFFRNFRVFVRI